MDLHPQLHLGVGIKTVGASTSPGWDKYWTQVISNQDGTSTSYYTQLSIHRSAGPAGFVRRKADCYGEVIPVVERWKMD